MHYPILSGYAGIRIRESDTCRLFTFIVPCSLFPARSRRTAGEQDYQETVKRELTVIEVSPSSSGPVRGGRRFKVCTVFPDYKATLCTDKFASIFQGSTYIRVFNFIFLISEISHNLLSNGTF